MKFYIHKTFTHDYFKYTSQSLLSYILPRVNHELYDCEIVDDYESIQADLNTWLVVPCTAGAEKHWPKNFLDFLSKNNQLNILIDFSGEPWETSLGHTLLNRFKNRSGHVVLVHGALNVRNQNTLPENVFGMPAQMIHHSIFSKEYYQHFYGMHNKLIKNVFEFATHDFLCLNGRSDPQRTALVNRFLDSSQSIIYTLDRSELSNWKDKILWFLHRSLPIEKVCDSKIYVATETYSGNEMFITEKTAKAFSMGKPFVIMGPIGIHKQLSDWGFKLFTDSQHNDTNNSDDAVEWVFDQAMQIKEKYSAKNYLDSCLHNLELFHHVKFQKKLLEEYLVTPLKNVG